MLACCDYPILFFFFSRLGESWSIAKTWEGFSWHDMYGISISSSTNTISFTLPHSTRHRVHALEEPLLAACHLARYVSTRCKALHRRPLCSKDTQSPKGNPSGMLRHFQVQWGNGFRSDHPRLGHPRPAQAPLLSQVLVETGNISLLDPLLSRLTRMVPTRPFCVLGFEVDFVALCAQVYFLFEQLLLSSLALRLCWS